MPEREGALSDFDEADEFGFRLEFAPDEPRPNSPEGQEIIARFTRELREAGAQPIVRGMAFDSVEGGGYQLPEFVLLLKEFAGPASLVLAAWIHARAKRKCIIKTKDFSVSAPTVGEATELAVTQRALVEAANKGKRKRERRG